MDISNHSDRALSTVASWCSGGTVHVARMSDLPAPLVVVGETRSVLVRRGGGATLRDVARASVLLAEHRAELRTQAPAQDRVEEWWQEADATLASKHPQLGTTPATAPSSVAGAGAGSEAEAVAVAVAVAASDAAAAAAADADADADAAAAAVSVADADAKSPTPTLHAIWSLDDLNPTTPTPANSNPAPFKPWKSDTSPWRTHPSLPGTPIQHVPLHLDIAPNPERWALIQEELRQTRDAAWAFVECRNERGGTTRGGRSRGDRMRQCKRRRASRGGPPWVEARMAQMAKASSSVFGARSPARRHRRSGAGPRGLTALTIDLSGFQSGALADPEVFRRLTFALVQAFAYMDTDLLVVGTLDRMVEDERGTRYVHAPVTIKEPGCPMDEAAWTRLDTALRLGARVGGRAAAAVSVQCDTLRAAAMQTAPQGRPTVQFASWCDQDQHVRLSDERAGAGTKSVHESGRRHTRQDVGLREMGTRSPASFGRAWAGPHLPVEFLAA